MPDETERPDGPTGPTGPGEVGETDESDGSAGPDVPIVCPACETTARVPLDELPDRLARHNEHRHGGEQVARVDPDLADRLADIVVEEMGLLDEG